MLILFVKLFFYLRLFWNHLVFWTFPTLEESHHTNIGTIYFELEKYRKAISEFEKAEKAHNNQDLSFSKYNFYYLGYSYLNLGDFRNSVQYFERYLKLSSDDYEVITLVGSCYESLYEPKNALNAYLKAIELGSDLPELHFACSKILLELGRKEEALEHLEKAEEKTENSSEKKIIKSFSFRINGDLKGAIEQAKKVISEFENDPIHKNSVFRNDTHRLLSRFQKEYGDANGALTTLELALKRSPNDLWLINELAMEYADQRTKLEKALTLINRALEYQPDNSIFLDTKGWILFKIGKNEEAMDFFQRSLDVNPNNREAIDHIHVIQKS